MAEKLAKLSNISVPEMIKELIKSREHFSKPEISDSVKKISGMLKTDLNYKALRDISCAEKIKRYENLH